MIKIRIERKATPLYRGAVRRRGELLHDYRCPRCGGEVKEEYGYCPRCSARLDWDRARQRRKARGLRW